VPQVEIFTDGSCSPNPGHGGWAALLRFVVPSTGEIIERELTGYDPKTTNNRMEMMAAIIGLEALTRRCQVTVYSDSKLLVRGATEWMKKWRANGWRTKKPDLLGKRGRPVANIDLWTRLGRAMKGHDITWKWVRGHNGHRENERVDQLAGMAMRLGLRKAA
jgi:ribonuclease HI